MDQIKITNLEVFANHGVFKEENVLGQKFIINATLFTSVRKAGLKDDLTASIHYGEVAGFITKFMKENTYQLIETVTEHLAHKLLLNFKNLEEITLEIKKPWAPIGLPVDYVSVCLTRKWHTAIIALGSNIGNTKNYLEEAILALKQNPNCEVTKVSDFICTKPVGYLEQDDFLNACLELRTLLPPDELLDLLHEIEGAAGRERLIHWGPRTLDLDIIFYDDLITDSPQLIIPHPEMHKRGFVLEPLAQISPYKVHPLLRQRIVDLLANLNN
ncbi:2-amino-4-hydroxy-6-hydroxymethyldihydropteridine diphosphokinase [Cellulosilyticum ruminicola]|uniref:2-amino-4-hydroxy-6- hydroxymethyldihydropteridine diphosphokinase n=1 Tax=Cellulosilyticum ruminicola TaxID=425254 RepID=UPI0006D0C32F|nr:2-amino-4-hydroxy-6-hydroxymethyldihydropteridine diphosphokinase [Cellulosilyticum ruminicola]